MEVVLDQINPSSFGATSWSFPAIDETSYKPLKLKEGQHVKEMSEPAYRQKWCKIFVSRGVEHAYGRRCSLCKRNMFNPFYTRHVASKYTHVTRTFGGKSMLQK